MSCITITDAIMQLITEYDQDPFFINCGLCEDFAVDVIVRAGTGEFIWLDDIKPVLVRRRRVRRRSSNEINHAAVLHDGKYYDAECPQGVSDYNKLPLVANMKIRVRI